MFKLFAISLLAGACCAQSAEPARFFKLEFVLKETEAAKVLSAHTFTVIAGTDGPSGLRTGARVPVSTGGGPGSMQYLDVGVSIDCRKVKETAGGLSMQVSADVSSVPSETGGAPPVVHQNRWNGDVVSPLQKSTVLFASDDLTSKHQMRLELTATPIR